MGEGGWLASGMCWLAEDEAKAVFSSCVSIPMPLYATTGQPPFCVTHRESFSDPQTGCLCFSLKNLSMGKTCTNRKGLDGENL